MYQWVLPTCRRSWPLYVPLASSVPLVVGQCPEHQPVTARTQKGRHASRKARLCLARATPPERCLLKDNKHNLTSHRHWHNWKITPLGSYILMSCFNYSPYILSICTACSTHRGSWEVNATLHTTKPKKKKKSVSTLPYFCITVLVLSNIEIVLKISKMGSKSPKPALR